MAANDDAVQALLHHCGVVRVDTIDELLDTALVLAHQPLPAGGRVAIVGNSGGPGIMGADACASANLTLATISADCRNILESQLSAAASTTNPVDLLGDAAPSTYQAAIAAVAQDPGVDALVVIHAPTLVADPDAIAAAIASAATNGKPVVSRHHRTRPWSPPGRRRSPVPVFGSVEPAIAALGHAVNYATLASSSAGSPSAAVTTSTCPRPVPLSIGSSLTDPSGRWLDPEEISGLLASHRIPYLAGTRVDDIEAACAAARKVGYPVVLKADGPDIVHKSDVGGVALGLRSAKAVAKAWNEMASAIGPKMTGALVQPMARPGVELIAGAVRDDTFGPLVVFGMGGITAELLGDRGVRVAPLSDLEAG